MPAAAPLISVVIPSYNHGHFLREALESVGTPARSTEIVVIDDGSTDATSAIAQRFAEGAQVPVYTVRQANQGLAAARNRGFRESRGRYVVFLDADDRLAPGALDLGAAAIEERPECFFTFGRCTMISAAGALLPTPAQPLIARDHYRELLRRNFIWMPAMVMFRREAVELAGGFNSEVNASADYELYLHIARHHPVCDHGQVVAYYRRHDANMSGNASRMLRETLAVMRAQRPFLEGDEASQQAYREGRRTWQEFYGTHLVNEIRTHVAEHEWGPALRKALTLGCHHPRGLAHHAIHKTRLTLKWRGWRLKAALTGRRQRRA
jgi:glycosyltransferase involved in cell wall biosynthesis